LQHWNGNKLTLNGIQSTTLGIIHNMGTSLNGLTPAGTYPGLIKTGDNAPIDGTLKTLSDGNGNNLPMSVSTSTINFTGALQQSGVAVPTASQVNAKQDTLVSGTNIKTINGTSVLGSGNIVTPTTNPSGVAGAIQFSDGSAFSSDASNFFWNNTTKRLGIGTNVPNTALDISASLTSIFTLRNGATNFVTTRTSGIGGSDTGLRIWDNSNNFTLDLYGSGSYDHPQRHRFYIGGGNERFLIGSTTAATIKGSGSTSATTSLLVQNSAGTELFRVRDDGRLSAQSINVTAYPGYLLSNVNVLDYGDQLRIGYDASVTKVTLFTNGGTPQLQINNSDQVYVGTTSPQTSAKFEIASTTKGFLPPRMTTTQKNAISSPASGLVVYDTTTNKLCCYNGTSWNDLF
jgi:hypothetical protein